MDQRFVGIDVSQDQLDVHGWARDALALDLPATIVCRDDCAGLCPACGENLNERPHEHEQAGDPRWSKLSELKLKYDKLQVEFATKQRELESLQGALEAKEQYLTMKPPASECCAAAPPVHPR